MIQLRDLSDDRLVTGCLYCQGLEESREHVPSTVFLDRPFPTQLPVVSACVDCNNDFSSDEAYVASVIEATVVGSADPDDFARERIANLVRKRPSLSAKPKAAKVVDENQTQFRIEPDRFRRIIRKLAQGHAAFELSQVRRDEPKSLWWYPIGLMTPEELDEFDRSHVVEMLGELGSRGLQRLFVTQLSTKSFDIEESTQNLLRNDWIEVQEGRYRYLAIDDLEEVRIKIVLSEYLACEVVWSKIDYDSEFRI